MFCSGPSRVSARVRSHYEKAREPFGSPVFARREASNPRISLSSSVIKVRGYAVRSLRPCRIEFSVHTGMPRESSQKWRARDFVAHATDRNLRQQRNVGALPEASLVDLGRPPACYPFHLPPARRGACCQGVKAGIGRAAHSACPRRREGPRGRQNSCEAMGKPRPKAPIIHMEASSPAN